MYPPFANRALGARVDAIVDDVAAVLYESAGPSSDVEDVVVQRMRVTGSPWRWMMRWRRILPSFRRGSRGGFPCPDKDNYLESNEDIENKLQREKVGDRWYAL